MNFLKKIKDFILPSLVLFLLAFIPLYPKLPLVDIQNTWVYIRVEDFIVFIVLAFWFYLLLKKQVTLKTPLTIPIFVFWLVGAIATIHGVIIIFPTIASVFPNVALLSYIRHIEYLSVFFLAYSSVRNKGYTIAVIWVLISTFLLVIVYGFGQKYLSFPAYLTMNEEYAKGIPIIISPLNRISSTFAGHYDLAAYLVLVIPIVVSLIFGFKNLLIKIFLGITSILGFALLFMTVSRVSFFVLFIALFFVLFFHKRKAFFIVAPIILLGGVVFLFSQQSLLARFGSTVKETDVLVNSVTGEAIGHVTFQPRSYLFDKVILENNEASELKPITPLERERAIKEGVPTHLIPLRLPKEAAIVQAEITSTGETLPQGTGYINLSLSPVSKRLNSFFFEYPPKGSTKSASVKLVPGDYLVKRASAYDLSCTTRFQGEWPNALRAFGRNIFFGSGYGSVSLAVDNNYYRMLGETGLLGTGSFIAILLVLGIYIKKFLPSVESNVVKSFVLGFTAGVIGLSLNAILIDVFEASKIAFQLWILVGIIAGTLALYHTHSFNIYKEIGRALTSSYAVITYLIGLSVILFSITLNTYFTGDDFTWFRWAAECKVDASTCKSVPSIITHYFFNSDGFFYRPGTKTYFLLMYPVFWLNQVVYHAVSVALHIAVVVLLYILARKIFKNKLLAAGSSLVFLLLSSYLEIVLWVSGTGHLFNAIFILLGLLLYILWTESKKNRYLFLSIIASLFSLMFHEMGIITPFLAIAYSVSRLEHENWRSFLNIFKEKIIYLLFLPQIVYLFVRYFAHTHWFNGDYSYNLIKLPFNAIGNAFGYFLISLAGPMSYPLYEKIRISMRENVLIALVLAVVIAVVAFFLTKYISVRLSKDDRKVVVFGVLFFLVCLIPFLGLGNITFRYSYLASFGVVIIFMLAVYRLYEYLRMYGRDVALLAVATLFSVFCLYHIIQSQQMIIRWDGAGNIVKNFLQSVDYQYSEEWTKNPNGVDLYFTKVPIKNGEAWVFPVGLEDVMWFAFKNDDIRIHQVEDISQVPDEAFASKTQWVFEFEGNGSLKRYVWSKRGPIEYVR